MGERQDDMVTAVMLQALREFFQDLSETHSIIGNIGDSALVGSSKRGPLYEPNGERLTRIVDTRDTIHLMTTKYLGTRHLLHQSLG